MPISPFLFDYKPPKEITPDKPTKRVNKNKYNRGDSIYVRGGTRINHKSDRIFIVSRVLEHEDYFGYNLKGSDGYWEEDYLVANSYKDYVVLTEKGTFEEREL